MVKTLSIAMSALFLVTVGLSLVILFNFSSFMEGWCNGYVQMMTIPESIAAFIGNLAFDLIK